jgi:hypothetical protein
MEEGNHIHQNHIQSQALSPFSFDYSFASCCFLNSNSFSSFVANSITSFAVSCSIYCFTFHFTGSYLSFLLQLE